MASNREERLQMRQRGAGTRKIKEVNFGFSFGLAPPPEDLPQAASQPADVDISIEPLAAPQPPSPSENTQPPLLSPERQFPSSQDSGQLRTPGGARNSLPERPSTFDIPEDDALDLGRSGKRRKIEPPGQSPRVSVESEVTQQEKRNSPVLQNGVQTSAPVPSKPTEPRDKPLTMQTTTDVTQTEQASKEASDSTTAMVSDNPAAEALTLEDERSDRNDVNQEPTEPQRESSGADGTPALEDTTNGKRKRRGSSADQRRSQSIERPETETESMQQPGPQEPSLETNRDESMEADFPKSQPGKRSRGRPRTSAQSSPALDEGSTQHEAVSTESMPGDSIPTQQQTTKRPRGRKAKEPTEGPLTSEAQNSQPLDEGNVPEEDDSATSGGSRQLRQESKVTNHIQKQVGRPGKKVLDLPESVEAPGPAGEKRKQRKQVEPEPETGPEVESEGPKEPKPVGEKRKRGRRSEEEPELQPQSEPQNEPEVPKEPKPASERRKRRKRSDQEQEPEPEVEPDPEVSRDPELATERRKRGRRARGEREPEPEPERQPEAPKELEPVTEKRKRRRTSDQGPEPGAEPETQAEPDPESSREPKPAGEKRKRGRRSKEEREPEPEPERQPEAPEEPEPASAPKRGRGRPSLSNKGPEVTQREEDPAAQDENREEASRTTRRKPRQPRGETVPVTVHRLANVASLGGHVQTSELSDEEESADELSTRQKTKLPSRGGVNVADVLSQICRETLEKTLTTLKNGISNEGNAARRSEWTTKKKAVEAFGTELEGRLFELSEMLDSNFILGVKLKKAKREMMDMRSRLYQLRKEREGVALQMDAVRRKHSEEENASLARTNINNSLHSLDLALERSRNRPADGSDDSGSSKPSLTVGLEFMLRNVADNVSSRAPGAQGGLLNQIKAFNAQLEAAVRTLES
ncbi:hypothetical protein BDV41DRAFT_541909 [Aspergillus transmontanensis]|uniref:Inner kinetochore subunit AME1 domain-containing protein n=1 Tax=Aspergillus transmontanensis TaxID=1034304 RepID=A0A5N6VTI7_9EURO|nr:hypothetical protein BDV41DRAFT_541909 [Aspergillus transmontanensis]